MSYLPRMILMYPNGDIDIGGLNELIEHVEREGLDRNINGKVPFIRRERAMEFDDDALPGDGDYRDVVDARGIMVKTLYQLLGSRFVVCPADTRESSVRR